MKCPNCGAENPDTTTYCQKCATPLEAPVRRSPDELRRRKRAKFTVAAAIIIVVAITVPSVVYVYLDPRYSWSSSIRDHDGDGVPDRSDPLPSNPGFWTYGTGRVNLTIHNNYSTIVRFIANICLIHNDTNDPVSCYTWITWILVNDMKQTTIDVRWLMGQNRTEWIFYVDGTPDGSYYGTIAPVSTFIMHDGQNLSLSVTYPGDFPPLPS